MPISATFVSDRTGWVLGCAGSCADVTSALVVLRTHDAGRTWRALPGPGATGESLLGLRFASVQDGFAFGSGGLWSTHDGGGTWLAVPGHPSVSALEAGHGQVWLLDNDAQLWRGPREGDALLRVAEPQTEQTLVLHGDAAFGSSYAGHGRSLLTYVVPGEPEGRAGLPCTDDGQPMRAARTTRELFLVCDDDGGMGDGSRSTWRSLDRGETWHRLADPGGVTMRSLVAVTPAALYIASDGQVLVSRDDGRRWGVCTHVDGLVDLGFESPELGFVIFHPEENRFGAAIMKLTHDDGLTWHEVDFRPTGG